MFDSEVMLLGEIRCKTLSGRHERGTKGKKYHQAESNPEPLGPTVRSCATELQRTLL